MAIANLRLRDDFRVVFCFMVYEAVLVLNTIPSFKVIGLFQLVWFIVFGVL